MAEVYNAIYMDPSTLNALNLHPNGTLNGTPLKEPFDLEEAMTDPLMVPLP